MAGLLKGEIMELTKRTTKEHYEKYARLSEERGVKWNENSSQHMLGMSREDLIERFKSDPNLNNIKLAWWDGLVTPSVKRGLSSAECVCLYKHCAIYQCIGATPEFE
jgi:hypothetical protein